MHLLPDFMMSGTTFQRSAHIGGSLTSPSLIVIHYTGSGGTDGKGDAGWFQDPNSKVSAHFIVGRDGSLIQCVPCNRVAWHAGKSIWKGKANCNGFSIGIEVDNWGLLTKAADGKFYPPSKNAKPIAPADVVEINGRYWERFPQAQVEATAQLVKALREGIASLKDIAGHRDIAPGRKIDPGDAWPMRAMNGMTEDRATPESKTFATVTASSLNVRASASADAKKIGKLAKGTAVEIIYDQPGWALVKPVVPKFLQGINEGWVSSQYLQK